MIDMNIIFTKISGKNITNLLELFHMKQQIFQTIGRINSIY